MKKIFIFAFLLPFFTSCEDMIETYPYGQIDDEMMSGYPEVVKGLVGYAYEQIPRGYRDIQGNRLDCLSDDAVITSVTSNEYRFSTGTANNTQDPFSSLWTSYYKAIANLNKFLQDDMGYNTKYYYDYETDIRYRRLLKGEAFGMRAFLQWTLLKYWGGRGIDSHELLGFPIVTEVITTESGNIDLKRNTYAECVQQIQNDCDSALVYLPDAHRDFLLSEEDKKYTKILGTCNWGKVDGMTMNAILADMYLTYASPLFNPENDVERWKKAAQYAYKVIDFKLNTDNVKNGFSSDKAINWFDPISPNAVFISRRLSNGNTSTHEADFLPGGVTGASFSGNGILGATQDLVEAFPMDNGYPVGHAKATEFDPNNPYQNRDVRLANTIYYPGSTTGFGYRFETWQGGKDQPGLPQVSRSGYHIKKMVYTNLNPYEASLKTAPHCKVYYRWENMILIFAEAANEAAGPYGVVDGCGYLTAIDALSFLRGLYFENDEYLYEAAKNVDDFRELVHNERRLELCFEGVRFFDLRRWNTDVSAVNNPIHQIEVTQNGSNYTYSVKELDKRNYPSLYLPIPVDEILRTQNMEQNEGWDAWNR